jgi:hypothetical protein
MTFTTSAEADTEERGGLRAWEAERFEQTIADLGDV